jgi:hypothetical protein
VHDSVPFEVRKTDGEVRMLDRGLVDDTQFYEVPSYGYNTLCRVWIVSQYSVQHSSYLYSTVRKIHAPRTAIYLPV